MKVFFSKTRAVVLSAVPLLCCCFDLACTSSEAIRVNEAAETFHCSPSDELSRRLARRTLPMLREREKNYRVGTDDVLAVSIFEWMVRDETMTVEVRVPEEGSIALPPVGTVEAKGKTVEAIENAVSRRLVEGGFIKAPRVSVAVKEFRSKSVSVVGAVENPGSFNLRQNVITLLDVLAMAGGVNERAGYVGYVLHPGAPIPPLAEETGAAAETSPCPELRAALRNQKRTGDEKAMVIDLVALLEEGDLSLNVVLSHGDVVYIPEAPQIYVLGFVRKPGGFPLKRPTTILEAVALAEGLMEEEASPRHCLLKRRGRKGEQVMYLDLVAIAEGEQPNLYLQADDIVEVRQTGWKKFWIDSVKIFSNIFNVGYALNWD